MPRNRYYSGPQSDHFDGLRFFNPGQRSTDKSLRELLRWQLGGGRTRWPRVVEVRQAKPETRVAGLSVTMIGHASVLIQTSGLNILVDPIWSKRASPVSWAGPKRVARPGVLFEELPPIDVVLVTHNHYDHMDVGTLSRLQAAHRPRIVTALGNDAVIRRAALGSDLVALDWDGAYELAPGMNVTAVPAHHWSARGRGDRRMALWCGFVIRTPEHLIYNVGDTGYGDGAIFREVRARFGAPDVAIIPIGAYEPRWFMADQHIDPGEAVRIMLDCGAEQALGVHWGTFQLTNEARDEPKRALDTAMRQRGIELDRFVAMEPGASWSRDAGGASARDGASS
jgi:L-ascorbate metabolism protein UlaG (beta-lactamase superfamily)